MDWVLTLPKQVEWSDYERELKAVADRSQVLNYRMAYRGSKKPGDRCFVVHQDVVKGWMEVVDVVTHEDGFRCTTTGEWWRPGHYLQRSGPFHPVDPVPMKGFQGVRRYRSGASA